MPKITDPDQLNQNVEVTIFTSNKKLQLNEAGNLTSDGVSLQALYSFLKEEWKIDLNLIKYPFPLLAITEEQFELINGWDFVNTGTTRNLIRDAGWALKISGSTSQEEYMNLTTLGSFQDNLTDKAYYTQQFSGTPVETVYFGPVNQAIKIFGDPNYGNFDYRNYFKIYLREQGKRFDDYNLLSEQNISVLTYKKYALPLSNSIDTKIVASDNTISGSTPYTGMSITYYVSGQPRTIGSNVYYFDKIINGNSAVSEKIYEFVQYKLRQPTDIDAGAGIVRGDTADELLTFVGDTLLTSEGVYIDNFNLTDTNRLQFTNTTGTTVTFPFVAAGTISFNQNLVNDPDGRYWMFFTNANGNEFGTNNAIIVENNDGNLLTGSTFNIPSVSFTFDYENNTQGGRTANTDADVTIVAIGLESAQYVSVNGTIVRSSQNNFSITSPLERNYDNS